MVSYNSPLPGYCLIKHLRSFLLGNKNTGVQGSSSGRQYHQNLTKPLPRGPNIVSRMSAADKRFWALWGSLQQISEPRTPNSPRSDYRWWRPLLTWWIFAKQGRKDGYILTKTWHLPSKMAVVAAPWWTAYLLHPSHDQGNEDSPLSFSLCAPFFQVSKAHGASAHPKGPQDSLIRATGQHL